MPDFADISGLGSVQGEGTAPPLSPLDSTLEHLKNLVGVGNGGWGGEADSRREAASDSPFELDWGKLLERVGSPGVCVHWERVGKRERGMSGL